MKEVVWWACTQTLSRLSQQEVSISTFETETAASRAFLTRVVTLLTCSAGGVHKVTWWTGGEAAVSEQKQAWFTGCTVFTVMSMA